jgi:transporter family-2 protein
MIVFIALAFLNGMVVGTSRAINGRLSTETGAFRASLWNHIVGFLFLTFALAALSGWRFGGASAAPLAAYLGGFFGALFVAVSSYVFLQLGAMKSVLLVISGQMISAVLLDYRNQHVAPTIIKCLGVAIVLFGVYCSKASGASRSSLDKEKRHA